MIDYDENTMNIDLKSGDIITVVNRDRMCGDAFFEVGERWVVEEVSKYHFVYLIREGAKKNSNDWYDNYDHIWISNNSIPHIFDL